MRKRVLFTLLAACLAFTFLGGAYAEDAGFTRYELPDLCMSVDIPDGWMTFSRYIDPNDPSLSELNTTYDELMQRYELAGIYLDAAIIEDGIEIVVTMNPNTETETLCGLDEAGLTAFGDAMLASDEFTAPYDSFTTYIAEGAGYIVFESIAPAGQSVIHTRQFFTVMNGQSISIVMNSYGTEITTERGELLLAVVDSAKYGVPSAQTGEPAPGEALPETPERTGSMSQETFNIALVIMAAVFALASVAAIAFAGYRAYKKSIR